MILGVDFSFLPDLPVSYLTIVLLVFALLGLIAGLFKGFGVEVLGLIKMAGVIFGSAFAVPYVQPLLSNIDLFSSLEDSIMQTITYVGLFIVIWIVLAIVMGLIKRLFLRQLPGGVSRFFGGIIGMVKAAFLGIVVAYIIVLIAENFPDFAYFTENARKEAIGTFLVDNNPIIKVIDLVKELIAK